MPILKIDGAANIRARVGGRAIGLPLTFVACGEMASDFEEAYQVEIGAKDNSAEKAGQSGQSPHPPDMNFDRGSFQNLEFTVQFFSGCQVNGQPLYSGRDITAVAEVLFKISMPRPWGASYIGPPLVNVQYGAFWSAKGFFQRARIVSQGAWDRNGYPTLMKVHLEFARHFGGSATPGGAYRRATKKELLRATAERFAFRMS